MAVVQQTYQRYPSPFFPGEITRPHEPKIIERGKVYVPSSGKTPKPGNGVVYNQTQDAWALPTSDAQELQVTGIIVTPKNSVNTGGLTVPSTGNSDAGVQYANGDEIEVCLMGCVSVIVGGAIEYGDKMRYQNDDQKWDQANSVTTNRASITLASRGPALADGAIGEARISPARIG